MTISASLQRAIAPSPGISTRQARANLQIASTKVEAALADFWRAEAAEAAASARDRAATEKAHVHLAKGDRRREADARDLFLARLAAVAESLKKLSADAYSSDVGIKAVPRRLENLAADVNQWLQAEARR